MHYNIKTTLTYFPLLVFLLLSIITLASSSYENYQDNDESTPTIAAKRRILSGNNDYPNLYTDTIFDTSSSSSSSSISSSSSSSPASSSMSSSSHISSSSSSSSSSSCGMGIKCAGTRGDDCNYSWNEPECQQRVFNSKNQSLGCCPYGFYCVSKKHHDSLTCQKDNIGSKCKKDSDCHREVNSHLHASCIDKKCKYQYLANDKCKKDSDCAGDMKCKDKHCKGISKGQKCKHSVSECAFGLECRQNRHNKYVCLELAKEGESCSRSACYPGYYCSSDNKCKKYYSLGEGKSCTPTSSSSHYPCKPGLYCNNNQTCVAFPKNPSFESCDTDKDCDSESAYCACSPHRGEKICQPKLNADYDGNNCTAKYKDAFDCYKKNQCTMRLDSNGNTCQMNKCGSQTKSAIKCKSCGDFSGFFGDCWDSDIKYSVCTPAPLSKGAEIGLIVGVSIFACILVVLLSTVFILDRRRTQNDYERINETE